MADYGRKATKNDAELIRLYLDTMILNDHLMQWYRALSFALQGILFTVAFAIYIAQISQYLWIPATIGAGTGLLSFWACTQRGRIVDRQKQKIKGLIREYTDLTDWFRIYESTWEKYIPRTIFNFALPLSASFLWPFVLLWFGPRGEIWVLAIVVILVALLLIMIPIIWYTLSWMGVPRECQK